MRKFQKNTFRVVLLLMMLSTASLGVSYSYAETEENLEFEEVPYDLPENPYSDSIRTILTERVVNGELEVMELVLPRDTTDKDLKRILSLEDTSGWSYIKHKSYQSGIVLFDGKVSKMGEKYWKISVDGTLKFSKGELDLKLSGKSNSLDTKLVDNPPENLDYRVIFTGKMTQSGKANVFAFPVMNSSQNPETFQNSKLLQFGNLTSESVKTLENIQKIRDHDLVI